jgi:hypothetical protein
LGLRIKIDLDLDFYFIFLIDQNIFGIKIQNRFGFRFLFYISS